MVVSLRMFVDDAVYSDFGDEEMIVSFHYVLENEVDPSTISVWYMNETTLELEEAIAYYDVETSYITFVTDHFSYWVIGEKAPVFEPNHDVLMSVWISIIAIVAFCGAILRMKR